MTDAELWTLVAEVVLQYRVGICSALMWLVAGDHLLDEFVEARAPRKQINAMQARLRVYADGDWQCCTAPIEDRVLMALLLAAGA